MNDYKHGMGILRKQDGTEYVGAFKSGKVGPPSIPFLYL